MDASKVGTLTAEVNEINKQISALKQVRKAKQQELDALLNPKEETEAKAKKK